MWVRDFDPLSAAKLLPENWERFREFSAFEHKCWKYHCEMARRLIQFNIIRDSTKLSSSLEYRSDLLNAVLV